MPNARCNVLGFAIYLIAVDPAWQDVHHTSNGAIATTQPVSKTKTREVELSIRDKVASCGSSLCTCGNMLQLAERWGSCYNVHIITRC